MTAISAEAVGEAIADAGLRELSSHACSKLAAYVNLLTHWNGRMNLTAIRDTKEILKRHIAESVAAAQALPSGPASLLDYGSGAGLPGIPIAIIREEIRVTLAESQAKKAAFLRECVRNLALRLSVHQGRVADLPMALQFDVITLRAVEKMPEALIEARQRVGRDGMMGLFVTDKTRKLILGAAGLVDVQEWQLKEAGVFVLGRVER